MKLKNTIDIQIKESMLNKNKSRLIALRAIKSAILLSEKSEEKADLDEIKLLMKLIKQRKDSLKLYLEQKRQDLADKEQQEVNILSQYKPEQLSEEDVTAKVKDAIQDSGATSMQDIGKVMGVLKSSLAGSADMGMVSKIVKDELS